MTTRSHLQIALANSFLITLLVVTCYAILLGVRFGAVPLPTFIEKPIVFLADLVSDDDGNQGLSLSFISHLAVFFAGVIGAVCLHGSKRVRHLWFGVFCIVYLIPIAFELSNLPMTICDRNNASCSLYMRTVHLWVSHLLGTPAFLFAGGWLGDRLLARTHQS